MPDGSTAVSEGVYNFTFTNAAGCDSVIQVTLNTDEPVTLILSNDTAICLGESVVLTAQGADDYVWTPSQTLSAGLGQSVTASPDTLTTYSVTGQSGTCFASDSVTVSILPSPDVTASVSEIVLCAEDSISIEAFGADYYVWDANGAGSIACDTCFANVFSPSASGSLIITGYLGQCSSTLSIPVQMYALPNAQILGDTILCIGDTVTYVGLGGLTYEWSTGDTTSSIIIPAQASGSLELIVSNPACADTAYLNYDVYAPPVAQVFTEDTTIIMGNSIQLEGLSNAQFSWTPSNSLNCYDCLDPIAMPEGTTTYCLTSVNEYGCRASDCVVITVDTLCENMFIPNVFAPDDKGHNTNNCFRIYGGDCIATMTMAVYSRWGEKVFEATDLNKCWDGTYHDKPLNTDVFIYLLEAELITGEKISRQGNLTLLR
jgi:gliding motility-associated-like protein